MKASSESGECASLSSTICSPALSVAGVAVMAGGASFVFVVTARQPESRDASPCVKLLAGGNATLGTCVAQTKSRSMLAQRRLAQAAAAGEVAGAPKPAAKVITDSQGAT